MSERELTLDIRSGLLDSVQLKLWLNYGLPHYNLLIKERGYRYMVQPLKWDDEAGADAASLNECYVDRVRGDALWQVLHNINLPICPTWACGLDGTTWTLTLSNGLNQSSYQWWGDLPEGWQALHPVVVELQAMIAEYRHRFGV